MVIPASLLGEWLKDFFKNSACDGETTKEFFPELLEPDFLLLMDNLFSADEIILSPLISSFKTYSKLFSDLTMLIMRDL